MRLKPSDAARAILIVLAVIFAIYVWPTPYKEYPAPSLNAWYVLKMRVNRFTGSQQLLLFDRGWEPAGSLGESAPGKK